MSTPRTKKSVAAWLEPSEYALISRIVEEHRMEYPDRSSFLRAGIAQMFFRLGYSVNGPAAMVNASPTSTETKPGVDGGSDVNEARASLPEPPPPDPEESSREGRVNRERRKLRQARVIIGMRM